MNYKVSEIRLREDMNEKYIELTLERIHKNDNLERTTAIPEPIRVANSGSVSGNTDELIITPEPENTEEEMALNYIKGMRKYAPELFDTATEIKKFAHPPSLPPLVSVTPLNYVVCMDVEEYTKIKILVGDIIGIKLNKVVDK